MSCYISRIENGFLSQDLNVVNWKIWKELKKIGSILRILDVYFNGKDEFQLQELDTMFETFDFTKINDNDAWRIILFYFADRVLCARPIERPIYKFILNVVIDLECFNNFSWEIYSWNIFYDQINTSLNGKVENFKKEASKKHKHETYNFRGFCYGV